MINRNWRFRETSFLHHHSLQSQRQTQQMLPKCWYLCTKIHGVTPARSDSHFTANDAAKNAGISVLDIITNHEIWSGHGDTEYCLARYDAGARPGVVRWGTALQAGRSRVRFPMVLLYFFIDVILPTALWPCGVDSASKRNKYQEYFLG
jgi:hypothetical protein